MARDYECWAGCLKQDLQDFFGIFRMAGAMLTQVGSYERWRAFTRDHESLRVLGGLSEAGFAGFFWDFRDGGGPADIGALVRAYDERCTTDHVRLRAFTRDCGGSF